MTVAFRNVDVDPDAPVDTWPYEAIVTVIERGTIGDWLLLTRAIDADPWGVVARQVEDYLSYEAPYGVGPLLTRAVARARRQAEEAERVAVADEVRRLVADAGMTTAEFAGRIGTSRSRLSTYRSGRVVPSATMMHRMRRVSRRDSEGPGAR
ncbi:helix-turn-helix domain-containing protein [Janibacter cremeus]|uniref:DNA-binding transcriptional regulator YiaG n=1 Tax=Janibacter cremeus TaxID=1285192 RepID=A0A852VUR2_9MICO|nr:helix-turn-helix transcriptional regulator [Janibacter cremeus]NYF98014.1 DNA-binding transcriptional regulator YiaG [Janibacter cremeus]